MAGVTQPANSQSASGGGTATSGGTNTSDIDSTQSPENDTINNTNSQNNSNNTISAAADSSDNQPGTPQPLRNTTPQNPTSVHHPYPIHNVYSNSQPCISAAATTPYINQMYNQHIYSQPNMDLRQQQQQQAQQFQQTSFHQHFEQFNQQHQQQQQQNPPQSSSQTFQHMDYINYHTNSIFTTRDYKPHQTPSLLRHQPFLYTATSGMPAINSQNLNMINAHESTNAQTAPVATSASSSLMSPRVASSTSPSSSSNQIQISGSARTISNLSAGNPNSPNSATGTPHCKKCGTMYTNESELQEHITNMHESSPYGSSGYASSPYIKEEMKSPPSQSQQQAINHQTATHSGNPGEILDLDSQKLLYPSEPGDGSMTAIIHQPLGNNDPLHSMHSMQQRAGMSAWDQQNQEGLSPYLQQQQSTDSKNIPNNSQFYQSPKQSPYHVNNTSNVIKTEYLPIIKTEFTGDSQQYISDKCFEPTAPNQQQQMMPPALSSSPAEFPSTTTGGPQDNGQQTDGANNQQFRSGNFEPPSSSSATLPTGPLTGKAANWKSNEARRPKTYHCTSCNKWFTSSGHLKRHYNTTLHKNAVKSSGQEDPAILPVSMHHHPARDTTGKQGRRGKQAANANAQQKPKPVQPPDPPNSPQNYGRPQVAATGLTPLSHYAASPSPNSMYQQQQYQPHQYMPQVQSTTNVSPQHVSSMASGHHLQQQHQIQQQTVMNGHPNALAGLSVPPTRQQTPMPSSQMRGLLNTTMPSSIVTSVHIVKNEHLEAATKEEEIRQEGEVEELDSLSTLRVKQEYLQGVVGHNMCSPKDGTDSELLQEGQEIVMIPAQQESEFLREMDHNAEHLLNISQAISQLLYYQLDQQHQEDMEYHYPNTTATSPHNNMQVQSHLIISHPQYQEQQHQMLAQDTFTLTQTTPPPPQQQQQLQPNIMEHQPYTNMRLGINTQQLHSNMQQLQQLITTEQQQLPQDTIIPTTNMVNMLPPHSHPHMPPQQQQHMELQPLANTQLQLDTINTNIPSHITTTNNMASYHQLHHQGSVLPPLGLMANYPHTTIGNSEVFTMDTYGNFVSASDQQVVQTSGGQLFHVVPMPSTESTTLYTPQSYNENKARKSPPEGDLPPMAQFHNLEPINFSDTVSVMPTQFRNLDDTENEYKSSPAADTNNNFMKDSQQQQHQQPKTMHIKTVINNNAIKLAATANKRKRNQSTSSLAEGQSVILPDGRVACKQCNKEFSKLCYLTQHINSSHGVHPYRCEKCGKRFKNQKVYLVHLGKHQSTDKAHKCEICPKQFHHKTDLRRHIESIHTGNKQHCCEFCDKSFCRKDHLRKHLDTHSRQRSIPKKANVRPPSNINCNITNLINSSSSAVARAKADKHSKDFTNGVKILNQTLLKSPDILPPSSKSSSVTVAGGASKSIDLLNDIKALSPTNTSTSSDDVVVKNEILEHVCDVYDEGNIRENHEQFPGFKVILLKDLNDNLYEHEQSLKKTLKKLRTS